jgi:hypothetical protein
LLLSIQKTESVIEFDDEKTAKTYKGTIEDEG